MCLASVACCLHTAPSSAGKLQGKRKLRIDGSRENIGSRQVQVDSASEENDEEEEFANTESLENVASSLLSFGNMGMYQGQPVASVPYSDTPNYIAAQDNHHGQMGSHGHGGGGRGLPPTQDILYNGYMNRAPRLPHVDDNFAPTSPGPGQARDTRGGSLSSETRNLRPSLWAQQQQEMQRMHEYQQVHFLHCSHPALVILLHCSYTALASSIALTLL
jgi:hypothetical protein